MLTKNGAKMMINLQLFAEGEGAAQAPAVDAAESAADVEVKADPTEIDVDAKIDAAVAKIQAKLEAGYKKQLEAATAAAKKEEQRLQKMSDDERREAELENARKELEVKEKELKRKEIEIEMSRILSQRGLPLGFMPYFVSDSNEETLDRIKTFEKAYKAEIEKLKGKAPAASTPKSAEVGTGDGVNQGFLEMIKRNQVVR